MQSPEPSIQKSGLLIKQRSIHVKINYEGVGGQVWESLLLAA
jgi:hypothetical protein